MFRQEDVEGDSERHHEESKQNKNLKQTYEKLHWVNFYTKYKMFIMKTFIV